VLAPPVLRFCFDIEIYALTSALAYDMEHAVRAPVDPADVGNTDQHASISGLVQISHGLGVKLRFHHAHILSFPAHIW